MDDRERLRAVRKRQAHTGESFEVALRATVAAEWEARELLLEAARKAREGKEKDSEAEANALDDKGVDGYEL